MIDPTQIAPNGLYTAAEACRLIPSARKDGGIDLNTWNRWRIAGTLKAHMIGGRWYMHGRDILAVLGVSDSPTIETPTERNEAAEAAMQQLRDLGCKV